MVCRDEAKPHETWVLRVGGFLLIDSVHHRQRAQEAHHLADEARQPFVVVGQRGSKFVIVREVRERTANQLHHGVSASGQNQVRNAVFLETG